MGRDQSSNLNMTFVSLKMHSLALESILPYFQHCTIHFHLTIFPTLHYSLSSCHLPNNALFTFISPSFQYTNALQSICFHLAVIPSCTISFHLAVFPSYTIFFHLALFLIMHFRFATETGWLVRYTPSSKNLNSKNVNSPQMPGILVVYLHTGRPSAPPQSRICLRIA